MTHRAENFDDIFEANVFIKKNCTANKFIGDGSELTNLPIPDLSGYVPYNGSTADVNLGEHSLSIEGKSDNSNTISLVNNHLGNWFTTIRAGQISLGAPGVGNAQLNLNGFLAASTVSTNSQGRLDGTGISILDNGSNFTNLFYTDTSSLTKDWILDGQWSDPETLDTGKPNFIIKTPIYLNYYTSNGFVKTNNSDGTITVDTNTYLTSISGQLHSSLSGLSNDDHTQYLINSPSSSTRNLIQPTASTIIPLTLKQASSQTADLLNFQNSSGVTINKTDYRGYILIGQGDTSTSYDIDIYHSSGENIASYLRLKTANTGQPAQLILDSGAISNPSILFKRGGSNIFQIRSNNSSNFSIYSYRSAPNAESLVIDGATHNATFTGAVINSGMTIDSTAPTITLKKSGVTKYTIGSTSLDFFNISYGTNQNYGFDTAGRHGINTNGTTTATLQIKNTASTTDKLLLLRHIASGTGNFIEGWDSTNATIFYVDSTGKGFFRGLDITDAKDISLGTTTGTKIGTSTTQKLGFWNKTPVVQQTTNSYTSNSQSSAYSGIDNLQVGTPYAQVSDLNLLRVAYETLRASYDDLLNKLKNTGIVA